jgi:hypothetical protein
MLNFVKVPSEVFSLLHRPESRDSLIIYRGGWHSGNTLDLYSGGAGFESGPGHRLTEVFHSFSQSVEADIDIVPC